VPAPPETLRRYSRLERPFLSPEYRYHVLGNVTGKRILDVGCGAGINAAILARFGADVTGVDISPGCIDLATRRAAANGVSDRTRFYCSPLELAEFPSGSFDVIWGEGILHHLLADLEAILARLVAWAKPNAVMLFAEPVALSPMLRRLRLTLPVHTDATPDERPLRPAELSVISRYLDRPTFRYFNFLGRLDRFVIKRKNFEKASAPRRTISTALHLIDYGLLSFPPTRLLAGTCIIHGSPRHDAIASTGDSSRPRRSGSLFA
jgi:SAM-dependent methyltransferase